MQKSNAVAWKKLLAATIALAAATSALRAPIRARRFRSECEQRGSHRCRPARWQDPDRRLFYHRFWGYNRNYIARLNPDGTLDTAFNPNAAGNPIPFVSAIAVQADGKILVGGNFTSIGGQTRNKIARLDATTGQADSFNPTVGGNGFVWTIVVQADGKILVGGEFSTIGGQTRPTSPALMPRAAWQIHSIRTPTALSYPTSMQSRCRRTARF